MTGPVGVGVADEEEVEEEEEEVVVVVPRVGAMVEAEEDETEVVDEELGVPGSADDEVEPGVAAPIRYSSSRDGPPQYSVLSEPQSMLQSAWFVARTLPVLRTLPQKLARGRKVSHVARHRR